MADATTDPGAQAVKRLVDTAFRRLDVDDTRLRRTLRTAIKSGAGVATSDVLGALAGSRRDLLAAATQIRALQTAHPAKARALAWLTDLLAGYDAFRLTLVAPSIADTRQHEQVATARFAAAIKAQLALDHALGCPYGCTSPVARKTRRR